MNANANFDKLVFAAFLLLVASLSVQKPAVTSVFNRQVSATDLIFPIVLVLAILSMAIGRRLPKWNAIYVFFVAYIFTFLISSLLSPNINSSLLKTFSTGYLVGLAVLSIELIDSKKRLILAVAAWLVGASIPVLVGVVTLAIYYASPDNPILQYVTYHHGAVPVGNFPRLSSTFISASMFCNYLTATVMLLFVAKQLIRIPSWLWWLSFALVWLCSMFTVSAGLGAFVLALTLWFAYTNRSSTISRSVKLAGVATFATSLLATLVAFQYHSTAPFSYVVPLINVELFPSSRIMVWTEALKTFAHNFVFGGGPGTASANVMYQNTSGQYSLLTDAHNSFLSVATQTGILGLAAFVALVYKLINVGFRRINHSPERYALAVAFVCAFVLQGLTGSFEDARHMWVLIGIVVAAAAIESNASTAEV